MIEAETITQNATFTLSAEQQTKCQRLFDLYATKFKRATRTLKNLVLEICQSMTSFDIPKQHVSTYLCKQADFFDISEDYLRRLILPEYKDQAQRDIRLTKIHEGGNLSHQHETLEFKADDIEFTQEPPHPDAAKPKREGHLISKKEYAGLQSKYDKLEAENIELKKTLDDKRLLYVEELCTLASIESDEELGQKVREMVKHDPRYIAQLKKSRTKRKSKGKK